MPSRKLKGQRLLAQIMSHEKLGSAVTFASMDGDLKAVLDRQIIELEARIEQSIASDDELTSTAEVLRSVPGLGPVASTMLIAVTFIAAFETRCQPTYGKHRSC